MITLYKEQNEYFEKEIKKQPILKKKQKNKCLDKDKNYLDLPLDKEVEKILEEFEFIKDKIDKSKNSGLNVSISSSSSGESEILIENDNNLNKKKGFIWYNNSCSFDSFITLFIFSIYPKIKEVIYHNKNLEKKFLCYISFIEEIVDKYLNKEIKFYDIYDKFVINNKINIFNLQENEKYEFVPIIINYRPLINAEPFIIKYRIHHYCTGSCKFSAQPIDNLTSTPYIDIPLVAYEDSKANNLEEIFNNYIYINLNTICQEESCVAENDKIVNWYIKKYTIVDMPQILSINLNINDYELLKQYQEFINRIFVPNINIYNRHYILIGFITQPSENHFVSYFQNFYDKYSYSINTWFKYNDMRGYYIELKNQEISIRNIKSSEPCVLFVYLKTN